MAATVAERFWPKVEKTDGCWLWTGSLIWCGYGSFHVGGKQLYAHRVAWEIAYGPIPEGQHVCHHCDNRRCVRLAHLFLGTQRDNLRDASAKKRLWMNQRTHCPQGHTYEGSNLRIRPDGFRECRRCRYGRELIRRRKRRMEAALGRPNEPD
jgi:ribosomal protein L34